MEKYEIIDCVLGKKRDKSPKIYVASTDCLNSQQLSVCEICVTRSASVMALS